MDADSDLLFPFDVFPATATGSKPCRKRTKLIQVKDHLLAPSSLGAIKKKPRYGKKPDPTAPKITRPCSECGKKFWSWKALFGHMRCHPERQWRGINPPPNVQRPTCPMEFQTTEDDDEVAACLLMLANGPTTARDQTEAVTATGCREIGQEIETTALGGYMECSGPPSCRFECSSCKKVFGSHQALGGHRASHKNVKGCFAIARTDGGFSDAVDGSTGTGHEYSVCMKVFSSGQALVGHKRRHWEKEEDDDQPYSVGKEEEGCGCLDLNLPPPMEDIEDSSSSYSSGLVLDLRLGLS